MGKRARIPSRRLPRRVAEAQHCCVSARVRQQRVALDHGIERQLQRLEGWSGRQTLLGVKIVLYFIGTFDAFNVCCVEFDVAEHGTQHHLRDRQVPRRRDHCI